MKLNKIYGVALAAVAAFGFTSCQEDGPDTSITVIQPGNTEKTQLDHWLTQNFNQPYNIDVKYRYEDIHGDYNYYLVPASYENSVTMAHLIKHLCTEVYSEVAGTNFTCRYFPKMFYFVGDWEYRNNGTIILGTAEGGRKIFLAGLNYLPSYMKNANQLNYYYFKTIHHEFTHILNQTKPIPPEYEIVTGKDYVSDAWSSAPYNGEAYYLARGFVSAYSQQSYGEDFAEIMSIYITNSEAYWNSLLSRSTDDGRKAINKKLEIVKDYMLNGFGIDLDELRSVLQRRQAEVVDGKVNLTDLTLN